MTKSLVVAAVLAATATRAQAETGAWSKVAEGVRARLVVEAGAPDAQKRPQIAIALDIENASDVDGGIPIGWGPIGDMLKLDLVDDRGKPLTVAGIGGSFASGPPYVVNLPHGTSLHVTVSKGAIEYVPNGKPMLRPTTFQAWDLPAKHGKLFLRATLSPHALDKGAKLPDRAWVTALELPQVALP